MHQSPCRDTFFIGMWYTYTLIGYNTIQYSNITRTILLVSSNHTEIISHLDFLPTCYFYHNYVIKHTGTYYEYSPLLSPLEELLVVFSIHPCLATIYAIIDATYLSLLIIYSSISLIISSFTLYYSNSVCHPFHPLKSLQMATWWLFIPQVDVLQGTSQFNILPETNQCYVASPACVFASV